MIQDPLHYGWKFQGTCNCNGRYTEKFGKGMMQLKIYPNNNLFEIYHNKSVIRKGTIMELKEYFLLPA